ncbi:hypothetical protein PTSG_07778 [Salpingoeca rosetta]|uniref:Amidohydrolase 3 domain-containing protein n=1 Tax=Salpingoeca rosetta (strain ATCC 50818 / BSB-021) TaxID=946362 RepID=F2UGB0_SALR5|nr:uncharacterized protein PTSG_07778 [Salpingoeca rosetta]EGD75660.1 hypothetical protein PTSG_07778 [Salpingoeca rosetta]|eukprot:XP_004991581.1 hypothetical protein PTSG_07778 [Salpingoeca rosetta]
MRGVPQMFCYIFRQFSGLPPTTRVRQQGQARTKKKRCWATVKTRAQQLVMMLVHVLVNGRLWDWATAGTRRGTLVLVNNVIADVVWAGDGGETEGKAAAEELGKQWAERVKLHAAAGTLHTMIRGQGREKLVTQAHENVAKAEGVTDAEAQPQQAAQWKVVDLEGRTVLPGLQDAHLHVSILGERAERIDLAHCRSIAEVQQALREGVRRKPAGTWCIGYDWDHEKLAEGRPLTRQELDDVSTEHPVFAFRVCVHVGVGNTLALQKCGVPLERPASIMDILPPGITPSSAEAADDLVGYSEEDGLATGMLREHMCYHVEDMLRKTATFEQRRARIVRGLQQCLRVGLTAVQPNDAHAWDVYTALHAEGQLQVRVHLTIPYDELHTHADAPERPTATSDDMLRCERVKVFADGSLGANTAALSLPYRCKHHRATKGILNYTQPTLETMFSRATRSGFQLEVHAIGDDAAHKVVSAFAECGLGREHRPILTHCQVLRQDVVDAMAQLQVVANIQPSFVVTDAAWVMKRLPPALLTHAYVWRTLLMRGIPCAGGSDTPVETVNPFRGMYDAMYRNGGHEAVGDGGDGDGARVFKPEERLSFTEALHLYTRGAAYAGRCEDTRGWLAPGYAADLTIVEHDVSREPHRMRNMLPYQVWVAGTPRL